MILYNTYIILGACLIFQVQSYTLDHCECGLTGQTNRIVGGWAAVAHKFPWLVPIYNQNKLFCGGAIINHRYILTAGHCIRWAESKEAIFIVTGVHNRNHTRPENIYKTEQLILHPNFYSHKQYDEQDIALIKVDRPIQYSNKVRPVCLPEKGSNHDNEFATVAGWGFLGAGKEPTTILQETVVKVLSERDCARTKLKSVLTPTVMCAYFAHSDSCQGDSGGPLVYEKEPGKMEQIGIVSWGIGCASPSPGIYTRVSKYLDWIYQTAADGSFCAH